MQALTAVRILGLALAAVGALLALVWFFQRRLIYLPFGGTVPPAASVLPGADEVSFDSWLVWSGPHWAIRRGTRPAAWARHCLWVAMRYDSCGCLSWPPSSAA